MQWKKCADMKEEKSKKNVHHQNLVINKTDIRDSISKLQTEFCSYIGIQLSKKSILITEIKSL